MFFLADPRLVDRPPTLPCGSDARRTSDDGLSDNGRPMTDIEAGLEALDIEKPIVFNTSRLVEAGLKKGLVEF